jgi:hypothetical protein
VGAKEGLVSGAGFAAAARWAIAAGVKFACETRPQCLQRTVCVAHSSGIRTSFLQPGHFDRNDAVIWIRLPAVTRFGL